MSPKSKSVVNIESFEEKEHMASGGQTEGQLVDCHAQEPGNAWVCVSLDGCCLSGRPFLSVE